MSSFRRSVVFGLTAGVVVVAACRDAKQEAAKRSAEELRAHVRQAREGIDRLTLGFVPLLESLAPSLAGPIGRNSVDDVRFELIAMNGRQTSAGALSFYPTGFVAAVGRDGQAIARNVPAPDDRMRGLPLATMFPPVRSALEGRSTLGVGELPPSSDQPSRVYLVAAVPVRDAQGAVIGALTAGISYGQLARSIERAIRVHTGTEPVLWVGLQRNGRVLPSGNDKDVPPRWLVPQTLIARIPRDHEARLQASGGVYIWTFIEDGQRGWAGALATLSQLENTRVLIFRSEAMQR